MHILSKEDVEKNKVNNIIVDNLKKSFKILRSESAVKGTTNGNARSVYRTGIKLAALNSKSERCITKVRDWNLELALCVMS